MQEGERRGHHCKSGRTPLKGPAEGRDREKKRRVPGDGPNERVESGVLKNFRLSELTRAF